jgi:hypothetical protein
MCVCVCVCVSEVSATGPSLIERSPTKCVCVIESDSGVNLCAYSEEREAVRLRKKGENGLENNAGIILTVRRTKCKMNP